MLLKKTHFERVCFLLATFPFLFVAQFLMSSILTVAHSQAAPSQNKATTSEPAAAEVLEKHIAAIVHRPEDLTLNTAHPQGGNPMSDRRDVGAVDSSFRVHGFENLFVCDASVFPTSLGINPQLTIMALADYAWRHSIGRGSRAAA